MRESLDECAWALYVDVDSMITNMTVTIPERLAARLPAKAAVAGSEAAAKAALVGGSAPDVIMARDWNDLNSGVWMVRASRWGKAWLDSLWDQASPEGKHHPWNEQYDIQRWYRSHAVEAKEHFLVVPQRQLQSYPSSTPGMGSNLENHGWHDGDWMVHYAGCGDQPGRSCEREFMQMWNHVGKAETEAAEREVVARGGQGRPFSPPLGLGVLLQGMESKPGMIEQFLDWLGIVKE